MYKLITFTFAVVCMAPAFAEAPHKTRSVLYPPPVIDRVRANVANDPWAASVRDKIVTDAEFWRGKSDEELWRLVFGPSIDRSWMVWSNGYSPITGEPVPMYTWVMDAQNHPWKTQDPSSGEWFPKNDFKAFYDSGLDEHGLFDPARADRSLLFNADHPDPSDPLHLFGVDDGNGYVNEKGERWRFIGAYLIYGHWKQLIIGGIRALSAAYVLTGDHEYAHKAGVLIDRVADVYPTFDFKVQGVMYEGPAAAGYVSTWHDACEETRELAMCYDMVFEAISTDAGLPPFLAQQAQKHAIENPKASFADVQRNIEDRILRDALANPGKIHSNYPRAEVLKAVITAVLQDPEEDFWAIVDPMLEKTTAVDGVTGEKGLGGYSSFTIAALAQFLAEFDKADPTFTQRILDRTPNLKKTYRFFIDTLCLQRYCPLIGDTGHFAAPINKYTGVAFIKPGGNPGSVGGWTILAPSMYGFLWSLYKATGDPAYVQILYMENDSTTEGLPYDIYGTDPASFQKQVQDVITEEGTLLDLPSVNKEAWHLAILRSGHGGSARALWLDYDNEGGHKHNDSLNLGLFAYGLDLLPEFGYPPVQFGGWDSPRSRWYAMTAAHNTVTVDGANQSSGPGETTLWADGTQIRAIRAAAPATNNGNRYERTAALIDTGADNFYVVDVFRVAGGTRHTKFVHSHYGPLSTEGIALSPAGNFDEAMQMRNVQRAAETTPGWTAQWSIEDFYKLLPEPRDIRMRYWDFTPTAAAGTAEAWVVAGGYNSDNEHWIPRLFIEREATGPTPLESTFVAVMEPSEGEGLIDSIESLDAGAEGHVALRIALKDGRTDWIIVRDPEVMATAAPMVDGFETDAELAWLRSDGGTVQHAAFAHGVYCRLGEFELRAQTAQDFMESISR